MTRIFFAVVALTSLSVGLQQAAAQYYRAAPWCAVIENGTGSVYWDCQYSSIEQCRPNVLAGNRGWCNPNPYFAYGAAPNRYYRKHHARAQ
ncbi:MAG TPA: DUF3551 domain-containing protein [Pseudolabrys sp.]|jgi:hypothetical protein|nr:DUF3551 domain-containing protein [Pseudolabrys sp.]